MKVQEILSFQYPHGNQRYVQDDVLTQLREAPV